MKGSCSKPQALPMKIKCRPKKIWCRNMFQLTVLTYAVGPELMSRVSMWSFSSPCSPSVRVRFLWGPQFPPTSQEHAGALVTVNRHEVLICVCMVVWGLFTPCVQGQDRLQIQNLTRIKSSKKFKLADCILNTTVPWLLVFTNKMMLEMTLKQ